jgi:hypothetical protein
MNDNQPTRNGFDDFPWRQNYASPWSRDQIHAYQKRLDSIAGKTTSGLSRIRLIWGADPLHGQQIFQGVRRFKYFVTKEIALQRFILEQLHEPEEYKPNWDQGRYKWEGIVKTDLKGDPPANGLYTHLHTVAEHDHRCCDGTLLIGGHQACYGFFGFPDDNELEAMKMAITLRDRTPELRPGEKIPQVELEKELRETKYWEEYNREKTREEFKDIIVDEFKTHAASLFSDDESILRHGKFHWTASHSKSGATLKQIADWRKNHKESNDSSSSNDSIAASGGQGIQPTGGTQTDAAAA